MGKILGLDLGSNSIGWALRDTKSEEKIIKYGVKIFEEGIKHEKNVPSSRAAERTLKRGARRLNYRRKERKYAVLKTLIEHNLCPLTTEELNQWLRPEKARLRKYPDSDEFIQWLALKFKDKSYQNPYELRAFAHDNKVSDYEYGRICYHFTQRRGFQSNRKSQTEEEREDGAVYGNIKELSDKMNEIGVETYGKLFSTFKTPEQRIRDNFLDRRVLLKEFDLISQTQKIADEIVVSIRKEIFFQRPLKSQKGNIGYCTLENTKKRCPASHPLFEEFRMYQFINNIRYKEKDDSSFKPLSREHIELIKPLFRRKGNFKFSDIKKKLKKETKIDFIFNYKDYATVAASPTTASIVNAIGNDLWDSLTEDNNSKLISKEDIWHVLFSFEHKEKLKEWAIKQLGLDEETADKFSKINLAQGYASLSKSAIRKIVSYLKQGYGYSHAVFMANLEKVFGTDWELNKEDIDKDIERILEEIDMLKDMIQVANSKIKIFKDSIDSEKRYYEKEDVNLLRDNMILEEINRRYNDLLINQDPIYLEFKRLLELHLKEKSVSFISNPRIEDTIKHLLINKYNISEDKLENIYHPSSIQTFKTMEKDGKTILKEPFLKEIKNPVLNRALFQIRSLINELILKGDIDHKTRIHIEFGRDLNSINQRLAYERYQKEREALREDARKKIKELYKAETGNEIEPNETDILRYLLWEEQEHKCIYTGKNIESITDLLNGNEIDIEHTLPRSQTLDNSMENKTVCYSRYNRTIKRNTLPINLPNYSETKIIDGKEYHPIVDNLKVYNEKLEKLEKEYQTAKKGAKTDYNTQKKFILNLKKRYLKSKIRKFEIAEIPDGFKVSQGVNISIINKYAAQLFKDYFERVVVFKSQILKDFKVAWGIEDFANRAETAEDNNALKKDRSFHTHHAIDAVALTFLNREAYNNLAKLYRDSDYNEALNSGRKLEEPMPDFKNFIENELKPALIVKHVNKDYVRKQTKRIKRKSGKIDYTKDKKKKYEQGSGLRLSLHKDTFYGAIIPPNSDGQLKYVVRKALNSSNFTKYEDLEKIVDESLKTIIKNQIDPLIYDGMPYKAAIDSDLYHNREKNIRIKKVRTYAHVKNPIKVKQQLMTSKKHNNEYKHHYYATNDDNYISIIYDLNTKKGLKRKMHIISGLELANIERAKSTIKDYFHNIMIQNKNQDSYEIYGFVKKGDLVLFYCVNSDEIIWSNRRDISYRLYEVVKFFGTRITFKHHKESRSDKQLEQYAKEKGINPSTLKIKSKYEYGLYEQPKLLISESNFNFLVEHKHFKIEEDGTIIKL